MNKLYPKTISLIIGLIFLYLSVKDIELGYLLSQKIKINYIYLFLSSVILYLSIYIKAYRLKILLKKYKQLSFSTYTKPILIRHFFNAALPGNLGEVAKPYVLKNYLKKPYFEFLSIVIIERAFDLAVMLSIFWVALIFNQIGLDLIYVLMFTFFFLLGLILFYFLIISENIFKLFPFVFLKQFKIGANNALKDKYQIIKVSLITIFLWIILCSADFFLFLSFDVLNEIVTIPNIIFLTCLIVIAQLIPSTPSSIGLFNYLVIQTLEFFFTVNNIDFDLSLKTQITSISFIVLFISVLPDITWGLFVFIKETSLKLKDLKLFSDKI